MTLEDLTPEQRGMIWHGKRIRVAPDCSNLPAYMDLVNRGLMTGSTHDAGPGRGWTGLFQLTEAGLRVRDQLAKRAEGQPLVETKPDPSPAPASRWVPVEERLPEPGATVKVLRDWAHAWKESLSRLPSGNTYWSGESYHTKPVTHWLEEVVPPLPERPKEKVPDPPGKWVRWASATANELVRTGGRFVIVSAGGGHVDDTGVAYYSGTNGRLFDVRNDVEAGFRQPAWIIREEDFLALCPGPWRGFEMERGRDERSED